jgi:hypothetical protein
MIYDPGSQAEKKAVLENERKLRHPSQEPRTPSTYFEIAQQQNPTKPFDPQPSLAVPRLPESSPWSGSVDRAPEPPLGFSVDEIGEALGGASPKPGER